MIVIGVTGPIGCGKSTVAGWLAELGARVIDADLVARDATPPGSPELTAIVEAFGSGVLAADGSLDRAALGRIVFADPAALRRLEEIVHPAARPLILSAIEAARTDGAEVVVVEAIKLVEGGLSALCDEVWLVTCAADVQLERVRARALERDQDPDDAASRVTAQSGLVDRLRPFATRVIDTSGTPEATRALVSAAWANAIS